MVYVALVINAYDRRIVNGKVSLGATANFVLDAFDQAIHCRRPGPASAEEMATLRRVYRFNRHRLFGPIGHSPPAEADANCCEARGNLDTVAWLI